MSGRAANQAHWYPAGGGRGAMATVAAGVDFLAEQVAEGWRLSAWDEKESTMEVVDTFPSFGELRDHVDLQAPAYARYNRQVRVHEGRAVNPEDELADLKQRLLA